MSRKRKSLLWLGVILLIQLLVLAAVIGQYELIVHQGAEVRLPCTGVDPYDPFRGRYVRTRTAFRYTLKDAAEREFVQKHAGEMFFVRLVENPETPGIFQGVELAERPGPDGIWMRMKVNLWRSVLWDSPELLPEDGESAEVVEEKKAYANLDLPQQRLFLNEHIAFRAEQILARANENAVAVYRVRKCHAVLMDIEVEGRSIRQRASEDPDAARKALEESQEIDPDSFSQNVL